MTISTTFWLLDLVDKGVDCVQYRLFNPVTGEQTSQSLVHHAAAANRVFDQIRGEAARRGIHVQLPPNLDETRTALVEVIPLNATTWRSKSGSVGVSVPRETGHSRRSSRRTWNRRLMAIGPGRSMRTLDRGALRRLRSKQVFPLKATSQNDAAMKKAFLRVAVPNFARKELTRPAGYVTSPSRQSPFCLTVSLAPVVREYVLGS